MSHPFSDQYIRMAKAAKEIQAGHHEQAGNYFECDCMGEVWIYPNYPDGEDRHSCDKFIPRLDQLLVMLGDPLDFLEAEIECVPDREGGYDPSFQSVEMSVDPPDWHELALAVVMREKFRKKWDGEKWIS